MNQGLPSAPGTARSVINDCWNAIGVRGDASCPALDQLVHCRNCPVYSAAAAELLDRDLPADYVADGTSRFAREKPDETLGTHSVVIFRVGAEWLALPTSVFEEVVNPGPIHPLPHRRSGMVLGLANVRGELLVCVSLGQMLGLEQAAGWEPEKHRTVYPRLLVIRREGSRAVVRVDDVHGTHRFHPRELRAVPATVAKAAATYTTAMLSWGERSVGLLDDQLLFSALQRSLA